VATPARVVRVASSGQYGVEFRGVDKSATGPLRAFVDGATEKAAS
jgi:hypothetical protein